MPNFLDCDTDSHGGEYSLESVFSDEKKIILNEVDFGKNEKY